ncbi:MAG TPA: GAF domain-containing protein [Anaerolineae bacterium]|nr:GAF domain-containing protein [Anaerolineae bacterium]
MSHEVLKNRLEELFTSPGGSPPTGPLTLDRKPAPAGPEAAVSAQQTHERLYRALSRISQTLNRLAAPSEILELIYTAAGEVLDNRNFSIALYDKANRFLSFPICTIDGARREVGSRPMGNGLTEYVIRTRAPLLLPGDVQPEIQKWGIDEIAKSPTEGSGGRPARSLLSVPLMAGDKVVGVVTLQDDENAGVYTTEHLELLTLLASQAAGALENARLFAEARAALAERQQAEDALKSSEALYHSLVDTLPLNVFRKGRDSRFTFGNSKFRASLGVTLEELIGKSDFDFYPAELAEKYVQDDRMVMEARQGYETVEEHQPPDGERIYVQVVKTPLLDTKGEVAGTQCMFWDVSESRRAQAQAARRAVQLQTAAEVSRAASSILNPDELLPRVVDLIRDAFDLYYVGIFLVDLDGQHAVLRAGSGEAGRLMLERGHRLAIGDSSMIGWCVAHCEPRVAHDVGGETVRFDNPLLPETRSELALPLAARGDVLGAMTVQSRLASAFSEQDISVLQTMADQVAHAIANAQLFEQESRRSAELSVLNEMGRTLASVLEVDAVYELIYEYTARLMDASNFFIALYDEEEGQVSFPIAYNDNQRISVPSRPLRSGLTDYVLRHRQPLLLSEDIPAHMERLGIEFLALDNATPALSWLGVPMNYGDRILGAIVVQSVTTPALYRDAQRDRDVLTAIASQTAVALENARLFEQTRRQLDHLATIQQTLSALTATFTREEMIDALLPRVASAVRADTVSMFLAEGEHLVRVGRYPLDDDSPRSEAERDESMAAPALRSPRPKGAGSVVEGLRLGQAIALADYPLAQRVIETRQPLAILADDPQLQENARRAFRAAGITASATIPLVGREGVLGTLAVSLSQPGRAFSQDDLGLLQTLAGQATVALEKVRLLEETRHLAQHRQLINQVTAKMRSATTVDEVLRIAVDELRQAAHATRAVARLNPPAPMHGNGQTGRTDPPLPSQTTGEGPGVRGDAPGQETAP